ncbi:MAG: HAD hydrolase-like protein [Methanothrix sp.]|jgi:FMN phosphatase YigB (HAD superfamily)|uniref:HAD family hydrolase n=1 Tax=Methanothrix sp. TaxID=90426 RepID=UPI0025E2D8F4|nr:HAD hydrolase-like protein [Methanothrix sp.]MCK9406067.1 HAD hydrolase-like protein [Methanothrix sp.]
MRSAIFFDLTQTLLEKVNGQYYLYSDALDTLKGLRERGYRLGLISNLSEGVTVDEVHTFLAECSIASFIDLNLIILSSEHPENIKKPDKRIFDRALGKSGLVKAENMAIFVTEEHEHILAARSYGWRAILKRNWGECQPEDGECVTSLTELLSLL